MYVYRFTNYFQSTNDTCVTASWCGVGRLVEKDLLTLMTCAGSLCSELVHKKLMPMQEMNSIVS